MPISHEDLAATLKQYVEEVPRRDLKSGEVLDGDILRNALAQADSQTLIDVIMALGSSFADTTSSEGAARAEAAASYLPDPELALFLKKYIEMAGGFDRLYESLGPVEFPLEDELAVEGNFDSVVRQFEEKLKGADDYTLIRIIAALGSNFADASTPEGHARLRDALRFFLDFESADRTLVA